MAPSLQPQANSAPAGLHARLRTSARWLPSSCCSAVIAQGHTRTGGCPGPAPGKVACVTAPRDTRDVATVADQRIHQRLLRLKARAPVGHAPDPYRVVVGAAEQSQPVEAEID